MMIDPGRCGGSAAIHHQQPAIQTKISALANQARVVVCCRAFLAVFAYAICSSLLVVITKLAFFGFRYPSLFNALQTSTSALGIWLFGKLGLLHYDPITTLPSALKLGVVAVRFYISHAVYILLLHIVNVDAVIVFRSCMPLPACFAATFIFHTQPRRPSNLTILSLLLILVAAVGFIATEFHSFMYGAYFGIFYVLIASQEMIQVLEFTAENGCSNSWGISLFNNLVAFGISFLISILSGEQSDLYAALKLQGVGLQMEGVVTFLALALSCVLGFLITFFNFEARKAVSDDALAVTGAVSRFLSVGINALVWEWHAGPVGLAFSFVTIAAALLYQKSTMVKTAGAPSVLLHFQEEEEEELISKNATDDLEMGFR
ncbi:OLC1v1014521C1 [Oldenlandia corymbosa var. corymbosa]|uniref:OLC1v1014521C1 n=1 Tax=Oldenlandia corymbosa var. corymbosa TaxID=529605 RepID=A0AAV1E325_OLDCO|nr:OLC1v1014521C1 [Oldenlandia corymbosa var. corymbosa]